ncbi:hypothetical protein ENUP19_0055G0074 [Entamoeba nuttalli]|uniref:CPSF A subunit region protein, putative n=2 Tax=Entamoeba nuttalli TaxID=412467 RepID=K2GWI7_ENTNP|nr:CPSF A subunit region protein, putative [Entamoeba nuttalli P19]EKE39583.1 CPSF A subunit region protein, putative [Entamoeba nuttalli P19]|eukprot:XP_008858093.1 CPSF A subunit region protein, putative [Entamoeba nuttalli P19]
MQFIDYTLIQPTAITSCCNGNIRSKESNDFVVVKAERKIEFITVDSNDNDIVLDLFVQLDSYNTVNNVLCLKNLSSNQTDYIIIALCDAINIIQMEGFKFKLVQRIDLEKKTERFIKSRYLAVDEENSSFITGAIQGGFDYFKEENGTFLKEEVSIDDCVCFGIVSIGNNCYATLVYLINEKKKYVKVFDCNNSPQEIKNIEVNNETESIFKVSTNSFALTMNNQIIIYNHYTPSIYLLPHRETMNENIIVHITNVLFVPLNNQNVLLIQNELGDLFRILPNSSTIEYFDTIPPSVNWSINGDIIFSASESQNHLVLKVPPLTIPIQSSPTYKPQSLYFNISTSISSHHPLTSIDVVDSHEVLQIRAFVGKGSRSSLKILTHGLNPDECMSLSLQHPRNIWTLKPYNEQTHQYVVIGLENQTYVLKTLPDALKQCPECGIRPNVQTLHAGMFIDGTLVQIHAHGIITILNEKLSEQDPGAQRTILVGTSSSCQVVIALKNAQSKCEIVYFEYNTETKKLAEVERRIIRSNIIAMALGDFENGKAKKVAYICDNGMANILTLEKESKFLQILETNITVEGEAESIVLTQFNEISEPFLFLGIGMKDGCCYGYKVIGKNSELMWCKLIGTDPVVFGQYEFGGNIGVIMSSSTMIFMYSYFSRIEFTPISYQPLKALAPFITDFSGESIAGITNDELTVIAIGSLDDRFTYDEQPLLYTPRKVIKSNYFPTTVLCSDNKSNLYNPTIDNETNEFNERKIGIDLQEDGKWASEVGIIDNSIFKSYFKTDEAIICGAHVSFKKKQCFISSQVKHYKKMKGECWINVYNLKTFKLIHKTPVEDICHALTSCGERLLAGIGTTLRLYDLGKQILIRKCELDGFPSIINSLEVIGDKIVVGTVATGFIYVNYDSDANILSITEKDRIWHSLTASTILDETSTIGFDKLGSVFITETNTNSNQLNLTDIIPLSNEIVQWYVGDVVTSVSVNEIWKGITDNTNEYTFEEQIKENKNVIIYSCLMGRIGVLIPFNFREDVEFFSKLEMEIKNNYSPLLSNSFDSYRGTNYPGIGVIDGDLCDYFNQMDPKLQLQIANNLEMTPVQIQLKCEQFKHSKLF